MKPVFKLVFKVEYSKNPEPSGLNRFQILENWFSNWFIPESTRKCNLLEMTTEYPGMFWPLRGRPNKCNFFNVKGGVQALCNTVTHISLSGWVAKSHSKAVSILRRQWPQTLQKRNWRRKGGNFHILEKKMLGELPNYSEKICVLIARNLFNMRLWAFNDL